MTDAVQKLEELVHLDKGALESNPALRRRALEYARTLQRQLETPMETVRRLAWQDPAYNAALKICKDAKLFDILGDHSPNLVSVTELARTIGPEADPALLHRILRHLAAMGAVREQEPALYGATPLTDALRRSEVNAGLDFWFDVSSKTFGHMPEFLQASKYKNEARPDHCTWQGAKATEMTFFNYMEANEREGTMFANHMSGYSADRGTWLDIYPIKRLLEGADNEGPLIVDVGGGQGHDMKRVVQKFPQKPGRVIVQDLPSVISQGKQNSDPNVQLMVHDFFEKQPVLSEYCTSFSSHGVLKLVEQPDNMYTDARAYYLHCVLHDWPDDKAIEILEAIKPALRPGYSKVIINESMISNTGANSLLSGLDLILWSLVGSKERTRSDWTAVLDKAGYKIVGTWTDDETAFESVIEAELY